MIASMTANTMSMALALPRSSIRLTGTVVRVSVRSILWLCGLSLVLCPLVRISVTTKTTVIPVSLDGRMANLLGMSTYVCVLVTAILSGSQISRTLTTDVMQIIGAHVCRR